MKTQIKYTLCYQVVTPESAEHGDFAEHGFMDENGNRFKLEPECYGEEAGKFKEDNTLTADGLAALVYVAERHGIEYDGGADWANSIDPDIDYNTGEEATYSLHVENNRHWHHVMKALGKTDMSQRELYRHKLQQAKAMEVERSDLGTPSDYPQDHNSAAQDLMDF